MWNINMNNPPGKDLKNIGNLNYKESKFKNFYWFVLTNMKGGEKMEKLKPQATGYALASVAGIVSLVCLLLIVVAKNFTINLFGAIFHGIDLSQIAADNITINSVILGFVEVVVIGFILGWLFAKIYNRLK